MLSAVLIRSALAASAPWLALNIDARHIDLQLAGRASPDSVLVQTLMPPPPDPPGRVAHLCPESRRQEGPNCVFSFSPDRRLEVPWSVLTDPPWRQGDIPGRSNYGQVRPAPTWPLGYCGSADACLPEVGPSGRREPKPGRHPLIYERWVLPGVLMPDGGVLHQRVARHAEDQRQNASVFPMGFVLEIGTTSLPLNEPRRTPEVSTIWVQGRPLELSKSCFQTHTGETSCSVTGARNALSFIIRWSRRPEASSEAMFAAAANLFDRYLTQGSGMAR